MAVQIVSGFNPIGYDEYGRTFMTSFVRYWPEDVKIAVYVEEPCDGPKRVEQRILWDIPGCKAFIDARNPVSAGREPVPGWRKKDIRAGYAWRFDAVRFCRQLFIPEHAVNQLKDGDIFVWLDADVVSYAEVPPGFIESQLQGKDIITLGRRNSATELGFWALRVNETTRKFVKQLADCCRDGTIFNLPEWHSGFVFDWFLNRYKLEDAIDHKSLTNGTGHVWFESEIGRYTDHLKGDDRKRRGYSQERNWVSPFQPRQLLSKAEKRKPRRLEDQVDTLRYVLDHITPRRRLAIDVGAFRGEWTKVMADCFDSVIAFEPCRESFGKFTARTADYKNVERHNTCVMDGGGYAKLAVEKRGRKLASAYYSLDADGDIPVVCLDSLGLTKCDLIKIDVEGAELFVLRGARGLITSCQPVLIIERDGHGKRYGIKDWQVDNFLEASLGYECILENHPDYVWVPEGGVYSCGSP